jgi:deoxyuridine 5'-triphosphate nucleotidohydrolase
MFSIINTDYKAYLLGYFYNNIILLENKKLYLKLHIKNNHILDLIKKYINSNDIEYSYSNSYFDIYLDSKILHTSFPNLYSLKNMPETFCKYFILGLFDIHGTINNLNDDDEPECSIYINSKLLLKEVDEFIKIPKFIIHNKIIFVSTNCIDFLGLIYNHSFKNYNIHNYNKYKNLINWKQFILKNTFNKCKILKTDENAIIPTKGHNSDVGYDLTIIKKIKQLNDTTTLYDTGLKINVDYGYYVEIVPRSSLSKSGYMLANSIGIIEKSYTGNLLIALSKIDKNSKEIELPFRCCQMIFKQQIYLDIEEIYEEEDNIVITTRNNGGFGSSK